ncbi:MAG: zf-HC2 domain-containing protein [Gammaproteobacteria bacterium]|jgi:anti-sigma factor RsiW|nr:zf-HC2 domain-containing protein [Gammaproteobacteria bacterium]MDH3749788.1 zf-HC2 domain-containing protein [Gammaproteobacteria bacterium]MDH3806623.1 zf-HC2 domain-containing protein [Gammaproteobacteria bacterium]
MNCDQYRQSLDPYLDVELEASVARELESHAAGCPECAAQLEKKQRLRQALRTMPVTPPDDGFLDSVVGQTVVNTHRNATWFWSSAGVGGAVAAGVIAWLILVLPGDLPTPDSVAELESVAISLNVEKTFRLTFDSQSELQDATLTVRLPDGIEVVGYEGRGSVRWTTNVKSGTNILKLPLIVRSGDGGAVFAQIEHEGKQKSFEFAVTVI